MMHTGTLWRAAEGTDAQICVSGHRVQLSTASGSAWTWSARRIELSTGALLSVNVSVAGEPWSFVPDDPERFRWEFVPHLQEARRSRFP
jgi:hypothetical protein